MLNSSAPPNTLLDAFRIYYSRLESAIIEVSSRPTDPNVLGRRKAQVTEYADLVDLVRPMFFFPLSN